MDNMEIAIATHHLTRRFGDFTAVDNVEFEVHRGEIFGFLGPNGSGKTTTIRMLLGLMKPTSGSVEVLGLQVEGNSARIRPRVGYMSQRFSLYNDLTVLQNLNFYGAAYGLSREHLAVRIEEALALAGLDDYRHHKTRDLSGGWRQRLALSAAILHQPEILFLDEPTAGVDPLSRRTFWNLLYKQVAGGVTVFVTTHYMDEAEHCHRLGFIQHGKLIAYGPPQQIKDQVMQGQVLELATSDPVETVKLLRLAQREGRLAVQEVELYGSLVHVTAADVTKLQTPILHELKQAGIRVQEKALIDPSLEDVFIACMKTN